MQCCFSFWFLGYEIAYALFEWINYIVEELIARPKRLASAYGNLSDGVRKAIDERDTPKEST